MTETIQRRQIRPFDALMLVVGSMIGSGIFIVSAESSRILGSAAGLLAVWAAAGALTVVASFSCAELAVLYPEAGGPYVYLSRAFGPLAGFLYGWSLVTVVQTGTIAAVAVAFARFLGVLVPSVRGPGEKVVALLVIALLSITNAQGLKTGTRVQNVLTVIKLGALLLLTLGGLLLASRSDAASLPAAAALASRSDAVSSAGGAAAVAFATAMIGPLFSQSAWTNVTFPGAEVARPERTFPLALIGGCALVASLYVLANVSYLNVLGLPGIQTAQNDRVGTAAAEAILPGVGGMAMAGAILISTFGCLNGLILAGARVGYALAKDGLLHRALAVLGSRGVPGRALVLQAVLASGLVLSGSYSQLLKYVIVAELVLSVLLVLAVPVLRRKEPDRPRGYRVWSALPYLYAAPALVLCVLLTIAHPGTSGIGFLIILSGLPVYAILRGRASANA